MFFPARLDVLFRRGLSSRFASRVGGNPLILSLAEISPKILILYSHDLGPVFQQEGINRQYFSPTPWYEHTAPPLEVA